MYDFTTEIDKTKARDALYQFQLKLIAISGVFHTYDINCADICFKYILDELKKFKETENYNLLIEYRKFISNPYATDFLVIFSDESIAILWNGPKKISDLVKVNSILDNAISLLSQAISGLE